MTAQGLEQVKVRARVKEEMVVRVGAGLKG